MKTFQIKMEIKMGTTALGRARKDRFPGKFRISNEQKLSVWMKDEGCKKA